MKYTSLRITQPAWNRLCKHLFRSDGLEHLAFLPVGTSENQKGDELLAGDVYIVNDHDLVGGPAEYHLEPTPEAFVGVINRAVKAGIGLVEVHNHPFTTGRCSFSRSDWAGFREVVPYAISSLRVPVYGAVVMGSEDNADGVLWTGTGNEHRVIDRLHVVGSNPLTVQTSSSTLGPMKAATISSDALARFDRQVRAFGKEGQARLATLSVALVGLGGIGGIVAEELARMGVGRFVLIDHDIAESTNQNRLPGLSIEDVAAGRLKVEVARRQINIANPDAVVEIVPAKVFNREAIEALASVDLIVCGTDDSASRYAVNEIALAYLRPYVDIATGIPTENGKLAGIGGRYTFTFPGSGCLLCAQAIDPAEAAAEFSPAEVRRAQERDGYIQGSTEPAASVMPLNALVTSQAVFEVLAWVTGIRPPIQQRLFDALQGTVDCVTFVPNPHCIPCTENIGRGDLGELPQKYSRWASPRAVAARSHARKGLAKWILGRLRFPGRNM